MGSLWRRILGYAEVAPPPRAPVRTFSARTAPTPSAEETAAAHEAISLAQLSERFHRYVLGLPDYDASEPTQEERAILKRLQA
jgi:hypothetical protein